MADAAEPTKPQNSYWIWLGENREALMKEAGGGQASKVGKLAGERWKGLDAAAKKPFEDKASKLKQDYEKRMKEFVAAGGMKGKRRAEKAEAKSAKNPGAGGARGAKKARKDAREAAGKPKKPQSSYWLYLGENRAAITAEAGSGGTPAVSKLAGAKWKALSEAEKKPFEDQAAKLKADYNKAIAAWKEKSPGAEAGEEDEDDDEDAEEQ